MKKQVKIYLSYSNKDKQYFDELITHLAGLKKWKGAIKILNHYEITPGNIREDEINKWLSEADLVLFLVSSDFMNSDFIRNIEINKSLKRYFRKKLVITPVLIRPCDFGCLPLSKFQILPENAMPISLWNNRDEAWLEVLLQLKKIVNVITDEKIKLNQKLLLDKEIRHSSLDKHIDMKIRRRLVFSRLTAAAGVFILVASSFLFIPYCNNSSWEVSELSFKQFELP